jgi:hypothetical protein
MHDETKAKVASAAALQVSLGQQLHCDCCTVIVANACSADTPLKWLSLVQLICPKVSQHYCHTCYYSSCRLEHIKKSRATQSSPNLLCSCWPAGKAEGLLVVGVHLVGINAAGDFASGNCRRQTFAGVDKAAVDLVNSLHGTAAVMCSEESDGGDSTRYMQAAAEHLRMLSNVEHLLVRPVCGSSGQCAAQSMEQQGEVRAKFKTGRPLLLAQMSLQLTKSGSSSNCLASWSSPLFHPALSRAFFSFVEFILDR